MTLEDIIYSDNLEKKLYSGVRFGSLSEGARVDDCVTKYERKSILRLEVIEFHGLNCSVCNSKAINHRKLGLRKLSLSLPEKERISTSRPYRETKI